MAHHLLGANRDSYSHFYSLTFALALIGIQPHCLMWIDTVETGSGASFFQFTTRISPMNMPLRQTVTRIHSEGFEELLLYYQTLKKPYSESDIRAFNAIYRCVYQNLSREEKRRSEALVDLILADLDEPRLACLIYGVV